MAVLDAFSMPPSHAFGWLCVAHSIADIAFRAAQIRSAQALPKSPNHISSDTARESTSHGLGVTVKTDTQTGKVDALEISASESSAIAGEPGSPQQLTVVASYQENARPKLPGVTESIVSNSGISFQPRKAQPISNSR